MSKHIVYQDREKTLTVGYRKDINKLTAYSVKGSFTSGCSFHVDRMDDMWSFVTTRGSVSANLKQSVTSYLQDEIASGVENNKTISWKNDIPMEV